jgi:hypothetical protein
MTLITDTKAPADVPTTNELDKIPDDLLSIAPAYYSLGSTPYPIEDPPNIGDVRTVIARIRCTGIGETVRTDGERRHVRKFEITGMREWGKAGQPDADEAQPPLFGDDLEPTEDDWDDQDAPEPEGDTDE